jgi:L-threonylcarbamoyladenylate synthase
VNTLLLNSNNAADLQQALSLLRQGELVAVPTETVYGLAADARQPDAVKKIFIAKERPVNHPLIVHIANAEALRQWADPIPKEALKLAQAFWPGPLTLLLHKAPGVDTTVTGGRDTIALRVPDHPVLLELLRELDSGLAAPSANPHQQLSPTSAEQVMKILGGRIAAVLDGGSCQIGLESTIVDLTDAGAPRILRSGPITRAQVEEVLGLRVQVPATHTVAAPGNMQTHYQPRSPLHVLPRAELFELLKHEDAAQSAVVLYGEAATPPTPPLALRCLSRDKSAYARALYHTLHELDQLHPARILLEQPPQDETWADVNDRLSKAATPFV